MQCFLYFSLDWYSVVIPIGQTIVNIQLPELLHTFFSILYDLINKTNLQSLGNQWPNDLNFVWSENKFQ